MKALAIIAMLFAAGCREEAKTTVPPLRPLIYTEHPDITPEGAAVQERRLLRQLNAGATGGWGSLEPARTLPRVATPEALARRVTDALLTQDEALWDGSFVTPVDYANLVHVDLDAATAFVDDVMGGSRNAWLLFDPPMPSEMVDGGFPAVFSFVRLEPGSGRDIQGKPAEGAAIEQYWNARIVWRYNRQPDVEFGILIPKIVRSGHGAGWGIASSLRAEGPLDELIALGLHLKPELLRNDEYPMPLKVGNYWKYRRSGAERPPATEVLDEVLSVDLYGALRLVKVRRLYNDADLSKVERTLLLTPRRIYICGRKCRAAAPNLRRLLPILRAARPLMRFPIREADILSVVAELETPAGHFANMVTLEVPGEEICDAEGRCAPMNDVVTFAVGRGVVRREKRGIQKVTEELVDYRLVP